VSWLFLRIVPLAVLGVALIAVGTVYLNRGEHLLGYLNLAGGILLVARACWEVRKRTILRTHDEGRAT